MNYLKGIFTLVAVTLLSSTSISQEITQTIRGQVIDKQSQYGIPGAIISLFGFRSIHKGRF